MNIRSVTYFDQLGYPFNEERVAAAGKFLAEARQAFVDAGFTVQSTRLALPPLSVTFEESPSAAIVKYAQDLEAACFVHGVDYSVIGVARPTDPAAYFEVIPDVIAETQNVFGSAIIASPHDGVSLAAVQRAAGIIQRCALISPDGFGNLRFAALANVSAGVPFLPAAYHDGSSPSFAIATESADLAVTAFGGATSLDEARDRLIAAIDDHAKRIAAIAKKVGGARNLKFGGIDFSAAPFPSRDRSIGAALELLGVPSVGMFGTLAAAAFVADAINRADFPAVGFSGLFLPVLEDSVLAARGAEGVLTVGDLLLYSAVCGTGLDTVPLPGDLAAEEIAPMLLDVAALALRLDKPLTARLMPMPGKKAGEEVTFDFPFFANGRVLAAGRKSQPLRGLLAGGGAFSLSPRSRNQ